MNKLYLFRSYGYSMLVRRGMCNKPPASSPTPESHGNLRNMSAKYSPSDFQRFILVWTKKYKTKEEIPKFVSPDLIERARSEARIKIANVLMLLTALASFGAILSGKAAAKRGESVHQMNLDWHKQYQEEQRQKEVSK